MRHALTATFVVCSLVLSLAASAAAQAVAPAKALEKFNVMLGNWEGEGKVRMTAGGDTLPWTARSTVKKIMNGHIIQEDVRIDIGEGMPAMIFRTLYGWDAGAERCQAFSCGNIGSFSLTPVYWTDDGALVQSSAMIEDGKVAVDTWVTHFTENASTFQGHRSEEGGPFFVHVEGGMKRGGTGFSLTAENSGPAVKPPHAKLEPVAVLTGTWSFKGSMRPSPGAPRISISGRETINPILGGNGYMLQIKGDPTPDMPDMPAYEGCAYIGWDANRKCLRTVGVNNYGEFHVADMYCENGNRMIFIAADRMRGAPTAARTVLECSDDKNQIKTWSDTMSGAGETDRSFEGTYTRTKT